MKRGVSYFSQEWSTSVHFNGLRKASPEFHSRAGDNRSGEAGAKILGDKS